ncbi:unnamed protein product [Meloidogyne enterolobii]|uniref:Uncharacterized protein n=1 Tax=Meloidogyne enterolobii TaxID=390850 RepID=A0ACB0ZP99_MELEN
MLKFPFQVNKGCGNCPSKTCITCYKHKCNDGNDLPYYCLDYDGKSVIECKKSDCYIDKCMFILSFGKGILIFEIPIIL